MRRCTPDQGNQVSYTSFSKPLPRVVHTVPFCSRHGGAHVSCNCVRPLPYQTLLARAVQIEQLERHAVGPSEAVLQRILASASATGSRTFYCSVPFCLELKRLLARMTFCRMSRALLVQMNGLGSVLW